MMNCEVNAEQQQQQQFFFFFENELTPILLSIELHLCNTLKKNMFVSFSIGCEERYKSRHRMLHCIEQNRLKQYHALKKLLEYTTTIDITNWSGLTQTIRTLLSVLVLPMLTTMFHPTDHLSLIHQYHFLLILNNELFLEVYLGMYNEL